MYLFPPRLAVTISLDLNVKSYEIILGFNQSWNEWTSKLFQRFVSNLRIKGIDSVPINLFLWNGNSPGGWTRTIPKRAKLFHFGGRVFMNFVGVNSLIYKGVYYCFLIQAWLFNFSMLRFNLRGWLTAGDLRGRTLCGLLVANCASADQDLNICLKPSSACLNILLPDFCSYTPTLLLGACIGSGS